jgi:hypothetical protein
MSSNSLPLRVHHVIFYSHLLPLIHPRNLNFSYLETRQATRFIIIASEEDMAFSEAVGKRVERVWWRKFIKTRIKKYTSAAVWQ